MNLSQFLTADEVSAPLPSPDWSTQDQTPFEGEHTFTIVKAWMDHDYYPYRPGPKSPKRAQWDAENADATPGIALRLELAVTDDSERHGRKVRHDITLSPSSISKEWAIPQGKRDLHGLAKRCGWTVIPAVAEDTVGATFLMRAAVRVANGKAYQEVKMELKAGEQAGGVMRPAPAATPAKRTVMSDADDAPF